MMPRLVARAAFAAAVLIVPVAGQAQLGKLGKKLGKAVSQEITGKPQSSAASSSAPVLTPQMLDAFLKGVAVEAQPRMAALRKHQADMGAYQRWQTELDSLNQELSAEYQRGTAGAAQCNQTLTADPAMMQLNMAIAKKLESMSDAERERVQEQLDAWGEKMSDAYQRNDVGTASRYADSIRNVLGVDVTAAATAQPNAYQQCMAKQQASAGVDHDRIAALNAQILKLSQNPAREPRDSDLDIPQSERDSLRVLGIAASGLSDSDYAWAREQAWAYLAMMSRGDEPTGDAEWIAMMRAREAELKKYEFVIAEG